MIVLLVAGICCSNAVTSQAYVDNNINLNVSLLKKIIRSRVVDRGMANGKEEKWKTTADGKDYFCNRESDDCSDILRIYNNNLTYVKGYCFGGNGERVDVEGFYYFDNNHVGWNMENESDMIALSNIDDNSFSIFKYLDLYNGDREIIKLESVISIDKELFEYGNWKLLSRGGFDSYMENTIIKTGSGKAPSETTVYSAAAADMLFARKTGATKMLSLDGGEKKTIHADLRGKRVSLRLKVGGRVSVFEYEGSLDGNIGNIVVDGGVSLLVDFAEEKTTLSLSDGSPIFDFEIIIYN